MIFSRLSPANSLTPCSVDLIATMSIISFSHVAKQYPGGVTALSDVSLEIAEGELVYLAGPSGAGKSSLLKLIAGIERPTAGLLLVSGQDMRKLNRTTLPYWRRMLGLILQQHRLLNDRSVLQNVMLPLLISGASTKEAAQRARVALDRVDLGNKAELLPQALSGGEQQRVAIARAIATRCCSPPDKACGSSSALLPRSTRSRATRARCAASLVLAPLINSGSMTFCSTLRSFSRRCCCKISPSMRRQYGSVVRFNLRISCPLTSNSPAVGRSIPAISFSKLDLPAPEGPARYTSSPSAISSDTSLSAVTPPGYCFAT